MRPAPAVTWRIARRELRGGIRGFRVFLLCLMLGVAAIAAVGLVRESIRQGLAAQGAVLLGGDAQYEFTYRRATAEERDWIAAHAARVSELVSFRSMVTTMDGGDSALTQVKAVDGAWPLLGKAELDPPRDLSALGGEVPGAFLDPVLADRLGLKTGDHFRIGGQEFRLAARLTREPDSTGMGVAFGPRSLVSLSAIEGTPLLAPGTLFESDYRVTLRPGETLAALKSAAERRFDGAGMRWSDARRAAPGVERFTDRLGAFLVLVGLAGLAVGGVGISATVAAWIERKAATIATLRALGATSRMIRGAFLIQLGLLGALGIGAGLVLGAGAVLAAAGPIAAAMPIPVSVTLSVRPLAEAALYGGLTAAIFALWPLARMESLRAAALYRDTGAARGRPRGAALVVILALVAALVGAATWLSGLPGLTLATLGGVAGALLLLALAARLIRRLARVLTHRARGRPALHAALAAIGSPRSEAASVIAALGLGLSVLAAVGQIDAGLRGAIARDLPKLAPAFFLIDIRPDDLAPLEARLHKIAGVSRIESAPMLRGVITKINGESARKVAGEHWVLRGDRGVTFSDTPREPLTAGQFWPKDYQGPPKASFAAKEAQELGLKLGDEITVNILGRDITAQITSFRDVDFSSLGIGFVLTLNPAALAGAPHSDIATVYAPPAAEAPVLRAIAQDFPGVTAIAVREAMGRVSEALGAIARAVALAASVTLVTGFAVLIGAAAAGEQGRAWEAALLKTLGATRATILWSFALRAVLMGAAAGVIAVGVGALAGWAVLHFVMEASYRFAPLPALAIIGGGIVAVLLAGLVFALRPLATRPASVLRASE
ncbi:MAG: ABC transporter permease [Paenirhodobacter sp.]|uniref:ABC transporter permease n=1 Tax=Paenirhodobacter sp. TaxID=1965326 RepID=UPI003D0D23B5